MYGWPYFVRFFLFDLFKHQFCVKHVHFQQVVVAKIYCWLSDWERWREVTYKTRTNRYNTPISMYHIHITRYHSFAVIHIIIIHIAKFRHFFSTYIHQIQMHIWQGPYTFCLARHHSFRTRSSRLYLILA